MIAYCKTCDVWITPTVYWGLGQCIWLHRNGSAFQGNAKRIYCSATCRQRAHRKAKP